MDILNEETQNAKEVTTSLNPYAGDRQNRSNESRLLSSFKDHLLSFVHLTFQNPTLIRQKTHI